MTAWAPAVGAVLGGTIGASGTLFVQARLWRHEGRTRWDERTLLAYAQFLQGASRSFYSALALRSDSEMTERERFSANYDEAAAAYEELILLDPLGRYWSRRLLCIVWATAQKASPTATDIRACPDSYRDARFHVRQRAQARLRVVLDSRDKPSDQDCNVRLHEVEWGDSE